MEVPLRKDMNKIIYIFFISLIALEIKATENLSFVQKNIKDILLDISEKIESLEKTFLLPDNGFIEDGDASIALVELDQLRVKLKTLEGEIEKTTRSFKISSKQQEHNLIDALKIACRKFTKEKTGKKPFTNINLVRI